MTATPTDPVPLVHGSVQPHAHAHVEHQPPTAGPGPAVRLEGLEKRFGDVAAVDGIDLEIGDGEFFSMLGPSGSGKTTTLRMIAGFELPTAGRVLLHGQDVTGLAPFDRDVNTVFQDYALFPHMTVGRQRRLRADHPQGAQGRTRAAGRRGPGDGPPRGLRAAQARRSSRAASASASRSRARSSTGRGCCSSTSPSARSTSSSARRCRSSSSASSSRSGSRSST